MSISLALAQDHCTFRLRLAQVAPRTHAIFTSFERQTFSHNTRSLVTMAHTPRMVLQDNIRPFVAFGKISVDIPYPSATAHTSTDIPYPWSMRSCSERVPSPQGIGFSCTREPHLDRTRPHPAAITNAAWPPIVLLSPLCFGLGSQLPHHWQLGGIVLGHPSRLRLCSQ